MRRVVYRLCLWLLVLAVVGTGLAAALLFTGGWWLPAVLPPALEYFGVQVEEAGSPERGRIELSGAAFVGPGADLRVAEISFPTPARYIFERFAGEWTEDGRIFFRGVRVRLREGGAEEDEMGSEGPPPDPASLFDAIREQAARHGKWVPEISGEDISVSGAAGEQLFAGESIRLRDRVLETEFAAAGVPGKMRGRVTLPAREAWGLRLAVPEWDFRLSASLDGGPRALTLDAELARGEERITGAAEWSGGGWAPSDARVRTEGFAIDPAWTGPLGELDVRELRIREADLRWDGRRYEGVLVWAGESPPVEAGRVPLDGRVAFTGNPETVKLEEVFVQSGFANARLDGPVEMRLADFRFSRAAELRLEVDLEKQPWVEMKGRLSGRIRVRPPGEGAGDAASGGPDIRAELSGKALRYKAFGVEQLDVEARWLDDRIDVTEFLAELADPATDGRPGRVQAAGRVDLSGESVAFTYGFEADAEWLNTRAGENYFGESVEGEGTVSGAWAKPEVTGTVQTRRLKLPEMHPIRARAEFRLEDLERVHLAAGAESAKGGRLAANLRTSWGGGRIAVLLEDLRWLGPDQPPLRLRAPAEFRYELEGEDLLPEERLTLQPLRLEGGSTFLALGIGGDEALVHLEGAGLSPALADSWIEREIPEIRVEKLDARLVELRPYWKGAVELRGGGILGEDVPVRFDLQGSMDQAGTALEEFTVFFTEKRLFGGSAFLPGRMATTRKESADAFAWEWGEEGALRVEGSGETTSVFTEWLRERTGVALSEGRLDLLLKGDWRRPEGRINAEAAAITLPEGLVPYELPAVKQVGLEVTADGERISARQLAFSVNESRVDGEFELPFNAIGKFLAEDNGDPAALFSASSGRLSLKDWKVENWEDMLPPILRRSGSLGGRVTWAPDFEIGGELVFADLALRPTPSLPSVDSIGGRLAFDGDGARLEEGGARLGGSKVTIKGQVEELLSGEPLWRISAEGKNVPLVRTPDMILRTDVDLTAGRSSREKAPTVGGRLDLRSSTLLVDLNPLAPGTESGPGAKPPFFSVEAEPFASWNLDLAIVGDSFMRVRSPYFQTGLSANFQLRGTLLDPELIGSVRMVEGELRFPGTAMRVTSGEFFIEPANPGVMRLALTGIARTGNYVVTMEVSQTLSEPRVEFESTPELSNAAIVRLLATGSTTGGGIGSMGLYLGRGLLGPGGMEEGLMDRLRIEVGDESAESGRPTFNASYEVSEDLRFEGGYDKFDAYNIDLIWTLFRR